MTNKKDVIGSVNADKVLRKSGKILNFVMKKTKSTAEAYLTLKVLAIYFEETFGFKLLKEVEDELRSSYQKYSKELLELEK